MALTDGRAPLTDDYDSNAARGNCDWRMIEENVPGASSRWLGTGTVMVELAMRFCMMTWLPRWRTCVKP